VKRSKHIVVRFTVAERAALRDAAARVHTSVSDLVRVRVLEGLTVGREHDPRQLELYSRRGVSRAKKARG
jgi:hypothetical protein